MYQGSIILDGLLHVHYHVKRLVVHLDELEGVLGRVLAVGDNHSDRVAHKVGLVPGQGPVIRHLDVFGYRPGARHGRRPIIRQVVAREGRDDAGLL